MLENNNQDNLSTEEIVEETQEVSQPVVKTEEKTLSQEKLNSILKKERAKAERKTSSTLEELQERIQLLEREKELEKEKAEIAKQIAEDEAKAAVEEAILTYIDSKVKEGFVEKIYKYVKADAGEENSIDKLKEFADAAIEDFPSVKKTKPTMAGTTLSREEVKVPKKKAAAKVEEDNTDTSGYYTTTGYKLDITKDEYDNMSYAQRSGIHYRMK